uniref:Actin binding LIM protein family member 2 n=1 Tax=Papio anubis TaxID=9555 RepID=A0A2I3M8J2_PAPAN
MSAVSQPQAAPSPLEKSPSTAILCNTCGNVCKGEVLRVQDKYFHIKCFVCKACGCDLAEGGFFVRQGEYICTLDYQRLYGTRCFSCDQFIEGEVVSALGKTYHPDCFVCAVCRLPFPPGDRVTFNGKECMCQKCSLPVSVGSSAHLPQGLRSCGGCGTEIKNGQALVALDKHWHLGCFKCKSCGKLLNAEYISKDGLPYCEADYHAKFGIRCDRCEKYITGRVLEAGEKHYHPSCALCVRCGQMFAEGEEMYLQGSSIWHPACRQAARTEDRNKETRTSSESIISVPASSTSGSPSRVIYAKLGGEILDYRDLAALPKNKAIYDIDRPDMISYSPYISHSAGDRQSYGESPQLLSPTPTEGDQDDRSYKQCRTSSPSSTGSVSLGRYTPTSRSPQHYSRPAARRSDGEDGSFDQDNRKKSSWLMLKGDADTRTNSPDLDTQSLSHSSGTDRDLLQRMPGDSFHSQCQSGPLWSRPGCQLGHARYTERGPCGSLAGAGVANTFHKSPSETALSTACRNLRGRNTSGEGLLLSLPLPADSQFHSQLALPAMLPLSHPWPRWPCPALYGTLCHLGKQSHRHRLPGSERDGAGPNPACVLLAMWLLACRVTLRVQRGC